MTAAAINVPRHNAYNLDAALRFAAARARVDYRAGRISLAECRKITRAVSETVGRRV